MSNSIQKFLVLPLIILLSLVIACGGSTSVLASTVSKEVICTCGCGEVLNTCTCDTAEELTSLIEQNIAQGQSKEQILQSLVEQYGKQVLAAPTNP